MLALLIALLAPPMQPADTGAAPAAAAEAPQKKPVKKPPADAAPAEEAGPTKKPVKKPPTPGPAGQAPDVKAEQPEAGEAKKEPWQKDGWGWGALPAINFNSDDGFGFGAIGDIYKYDGETAPYRADLGFLIFFTSKGSQYHRLNLDLLRVGGTKLRLTTRLQFQSTKVRNYCGMTPPGDCDEAKAEAAAVAEGLDPDSKAYEDFVRRYYLVRVTDPYLWLGARYEISQVGPFKVEAFGSYLGQLIMPGDLDTDTPYEGSLYAQEFGDGEDGLLSAVQAGIMFDARDNEPAPISGAWLEASVRGAGPWSGSDWDYVGFNMTLRGYTPLGTPKLVLTDRFVVDGVVGDPPTGELSRPGGSQIYDFFGGQRAGRGIRSGRVLGRGRIMNQIELRATVVDFFDGVLELTPLVFFDAGLWSEELSGLADGAFVWGTGAGLRVVVNKNFIVRFDLGFSDLEDYAPGIYIDLQNLW